jgi:hypothetical protein
MSGGRQSKAENLSTYIDGGFESREDQQDGCSETELSEDIVFPDNSSKKFLVGLHKLLTSIMH